MSYSWHSRPRDYRTEDERHHCPREETLSHPLKPIVVQESHVWKKTSGSSTPLHKTPLDPLSSVLDGLDPLSQFAVEDGLSSLSLRNRSVSTSSNTSTAADTSFEPWDSRKTAILSKYTTCERLCLTLNSLTGDRALLQRQSSAMAEKVKNRLEQLDDVEEGMVKEMQNLTQQEYMNHIEELNQDLKTSWDQDQRVKALKIAIQCSKLLIDTSVLHFYPSKFVLITDILDTFGKLVYNRILSMARHNNKHLPDDFSASQVPEAAKGTCRNWFYKIASIRELVPRFYVECALLRSHCFVSTSCRRDYSQALLRLTRMIRGIGDPLVAVFARCYLCRVGIAIAPECHHYLKENFSDFLSSYSQVQSVKVRELVSQQKVDLPTYLTLYVPALDWILQCVARSGTEDDFANMLARCRNTSALLLNSVMCAFKPELVAGRALELVAIIREADEALFPKRPPNCANARHPSPISPISLFPAESLPLLFRTLGLCLMQANPPESQRLQILNDVWKVVSKFKNHEDYMSCAEVWIEFPVKHFTAAEVNTFLDDIIRHLTPDRAFEHHYPELVRILEQILSHSRNLATLLTTDRFLPFLNLLQKEPVRTEGCKMVLEAFSRKQTEPVNDPVLINALNYICKTMHNSVNALTVEDERKQVSNLVSHFVRKVSFGRDFEQQLSFYVEARATFSNLDSVLVQLVQCVNLLAIQTRQVVKGHHTRKTASFVKACAAYCFITIPSLVDVFSRLELYLVSGQVALLNLCLSQADAFFKAAITLLPEVPSHFPEPAEGGKPRSTESHHVNYLSNFLSTLLVVPDHPDQEPLYLVRGLLSVVQHYSWEPYSDAQCSIYLKALALLSALCQEQFLYHVDGVESNEELYGGDPKYVAEVESLASNLLDEILAHLKFLADNGAFKRQATLALELARVLLVHADVTQTTLATLTVNLWGLAQRHGAADSRALAATAQLAKTMTALHPRETIYLQLANKLQVATRI